MRYILLFFFSLLSFFLQAMDQGIVNYRKYAISKLTLQKIFQLTLEASKKNNLDETFIEELEFIEGILKEESFKALRECTEIDYNKLEIEIPSININNVIASTNIVFYSLIEGYFFDTISRDYCLERLSPVFEKVFNLCETYINKEIGFSKKLKHSSKSLPISSWYFSFCSLYLVHLFVPIMLEYELDMRLDMDRMQDSHNVILNMNYIINRKLYIETVPYYYLAVFRLIENFLNIYNDEHPEIQANEEEDEELIDLLFDLNIELAKYLSNFFNIDKRQIGNIESAIKFYENIKKGNKCILDVQSFFSFEPDKKKSSKITFDLFCPDESKVRFFFNKLFMRDIPKSKTFDNTVKILIQGTINMFLAEEIVTCDTNRKKLIEAFWKKYECCSLSISLMSLRECIKKFTKKKIIKGVFAFCKINNGDLNLKSVQEYRLFYNELKKMYEQLLLSPLTYNNWERIKALEKYSDEYF